MTTPSAKNAAAAEMTEALRQLVLGRRAAAPSADGLVAASLLHARPDPLAVPRLLSEMQWDEEQSHSHWPLDDEALFYQVPPPVPRKYDKAFVDLNIALPIAPISAHVRVLSPEGENYYHSPSDVGSNILFGCYDAATPATPASSPALSRVFEIPAEQKPPFTVCDIWASFLRIHVGWISNCRADRVREVTELFRETLGPIQFSQPIKIHCSGVCQSSKNRLETRARFCSAEDLGRFRILRRALKRFVLLIRERFAVRSDGHDSPQFAASLFPYCKSGSLLPIDLRRYSALPKPVLDLVKNGASKCVYTNEAGVERELPLWATCSVHDVRLEMTHARAVDPRWERAWVLCRRMPMDAHFNPARCVLAASATMPPVIYQFSDARTQLCQSRFGALYLIAESAARFAKQRELAAEPLKRLIGVGGATSRMRAEAVPFFPITTLNQMLQQLNAAPHTAWPELLGGEENTFSQF